LVFSAAEKVSRLELILRCVARRCEFDVAQTYPDILRMRATPSRAQVPKKEPGDLPGSLGLRDVAATSEG
jgi:hypothetical protein